ncbi:hypothetical protein AFUB_055770 [Aspergillus fumigatus A1163]|uniref:Uncharacterized protein n=1 Tax=Aspergillus fumigatus (strain CBS 144.89 / FGSC A1163 / CEA10) TaxID=451804 RepID=B0Y3X6_ASPFC|nr:hypothetical protein AFUB_055770 [Aspergillus fumigatus A1163]
MILSIPCSPSPSSSVINTEGSLSLSPLPSPSLDAAQCRPNFWRIFPTSLDGRYGLDFVNVAQTSKILCGLRLYFSSVWRLPGYYYYQGFCSGNIHGPGKTSVTSWDSLALFSLFFLFPHPRPPYCFLLSPFLGPCRP